eukprot:2723699-Prymnesium_polylepis.2
MTTRRAEGGATGGGEGGGAGGCGGFRGGNPETTSKTRVEGARESSSSFREVSADGPSGCQSAPSRPPVSVLCGLRLQ